AERLPTKTQPRLGVVPVRDQPRAREGEYFAFVSVLVLVYVWWTLPRLFQESSKSLSFSPCHPSTASQKPSATAAIPCTFGCCRRDPPAQPQTLPSLLRRSSDNLCAAQAISPPCVRASRVAVHHSGASHPPTRIAPSKACEKRDM